MSDAGKRKVRSLRDLPQDAVPARDLWAGIQAGIQAERQSGGAGVPSGPSGGGAGAGRRRYFATPGQLRWLAVAATIAALAVGVWIGRSVPPTSGTPITAQSNPDTRTPTTNEGARALQAAYMSDPRFRQERAALEKSLEAKLASLPPDARAKVLSSLATIHKSMQDLEAALGKDPTNALLQELLVNTYQDEMRVLTTVHEASDSGEGV